MTIKSRMTKKTLAEMEAITDNKLTLGLLLQAIRESEEMSQVKFAELLDISKQQLCDIEHNRKSVSPRLAAEYAKKLGYSKEQFIHLSLQEIVDRDNIGVVVEIRPRNRRKHQQTNRKAAN